jgi:hypothetical protein
VTIRAIYGRLIGVALGQGAATGKFTASSLAGSSYVFAGNSPIVAGVFTAQSGGSLSGTLSWNDGSATTQSPLPFTGTYTLDSMGRVSITNLSGANFNDNLLLYLTGNGQGLVLSNDSADVFMGEAFQQQTAPFTAGSLDGNYELNTSFTGSYSAASAVPYIGPFVIGSIAASTSNGTDSLTGFGDGDNGTTNFAISGSFTPASNGIFQGTIIGLNSTSPATTGNFTLYMVDDTQGFAIQTDNGQLNLVHLQAP